MLFSEMNPRRLPCSHRFRMVLLTIVFLSAAITSSDGSPWPGERMALPARQQEKNEQNYYANAHPYLEESLEQIVHDMPELRAIESAPDQQALPTILEKTGEQVDAFLRNIVDLSAHEEITEEKLGEQGKVIERLQVQDTYLVLRDGTEMFGRINEYRMDAKGNQLEEAGLNKGYFVTTNSALSQVYFSTAQQPESRFRYLGEERVGTRDTYVVAFAQKPGEATVTVGLRVQQGRDRHVDLRMLVQGIGWVD